MSADVLNVFYSPGNLEQFLSSSACPDSAAATLPMGTQSVSQAVSGAG